MAAVSGCHVFLYCRRQSPVPAATLRTPGHSLPVTNGRLPAIAFDHYGVSRRFLNIHTAEGYPDYLDRCASLPKAIPAMAGVDAGNAMIGENLLDVVRKKNDNRLNHAFAQISDRRDCDDENCTYVMEPKIYPGNSIRTL